MRRFTILLDARAVREIDEIRASGAWELDGLLTKVLGLLEALPEMGARMRRGSGWSRTVRKLSLGRSPYVLYYRVHLDAARLEVVSVRHEKRRQPRL